MTEKQQIANYIKIMKIMGKFGKERRLFGQHDKENGIVYISDGCCIFPIPREIYIDNSIATKCPMLMEIEGSKQVDLKKFIMETVNDSNAMNCIMTTILVNLGKNGDEKLAHIYRFGNDFGVIDKRYVEIINLLPPVLSAYNPITKGAKSPIVRYTENYYTFGFAILPINCDFVDIMARLGFSKEN